MMSVRGRRVLFLLPLFCAAAALAQTRPLNPIVRVLTRPTGAAPAECEEGAAQQPMQRVEREELVQRDTSRDLEPPPSRDLRSQLQAAQTAGERNDRASFRAALDSAKALLVSYPPGGERNAANEVIAVYNDIDRLWEYLFTSPTGAFFSASNELFGMMTRYRGYEEFIRLEALVDAVGTRFYPTRESMDFLLREAANRLTRLGFPSPPPVRRAPSSTVARPTPAPPPAPRTSTEPAPRREPQQQTQTATRREPSRRTSSSRKAAPPSPPPATTTTATAIEEVLIPPPVVVSTPQPTTTTEAVERTETTASVTPTVTETTDTVATDTTSTQQQKPAKQRSVLLPLMLILIGAGVLILLFRASS